jgi:predicted kinase
MSGQKPIRRAPYYLHYRRLRNVPATTSAADEDLEAVIASADLPDNTMRDLLARLKVSNDAGEMLTFNKVTRDWEPWYQYVRFSFQGF